MTSEQKPTLTAGTPGDGHDDAAANAKLIRLDESKAAPSATPAKDINRKITSLDTDLAQLRAELFAINHSVEEGLDRLSDTDTDLTAKVSETYKRLGEIDNAYKSLLQISSRIDTDIRKLNGDVDVVARQTATGIKNLERSSLARGSEFARKNQQLAAKLEQLVETSRLGSDMLKQKIHYVSDRILQVEKNLLADIEALSRQGANQSERLDRSIEASKARILKLQSVDEAIIKRATTLEISAAELSLKSRQLETSVTQLHHSSNTLFSELSALKAQLGELRAQNGAHEKQIENLDAENGRLRAGLSLLAEKVDLHFVSLAVGLALVLLVSIGLYFYQQSQFENTQQLVAEKNRQLLEQFGNLQQKQQAGDAALSGLEKQLAVSSDAARQRLSAELAAVESGLAGLRERLGSIEGRFNNEAPFSRIGDDNIIHGEQWLLRQPAGNYTVRLAVLGSKQAMYELAARYNDYLEQRLSAYKTSYNGSPAYVLLVGNYSHARQAAEALSRLPASLVMEQPVAVKLDAIQNYIKQHPAVNTL